MMNNAILSAFSEIPAVNKNNPYTYLNALETEHSDIWSEAISLVSQFNSSMSGVTAQDRRTSAVQFLRQTAAFQRKGEIAFIENELEKLKRLQQEETIPQLKEKLNILEKDIQSLKSNNFDYNTFIKDLNIVINNIEDYNARLSTLQQNFNKHYSERGLLQDIDKEFQNIIDLLTQRKKVIEAKRKSYETTVSEFIFQFIEENRSQLETAVLDDAQLTAWLLKLSVSFRQYLERVHTAERKELKDEYLQKKKDLETNWKNFIKENKNNLLSFNAEDIKLLKNIASSMEIQTFSSDVKREGIKLPNLNGKISSDEYKVIFTSNLKASALAERMGVLTKNCLQAFLQMGGSGMGNDSIAATMKISYGEPNYNEELEKIETALKQLDKAWTEFAEIRTDRDKVFNANKQMNRRIETILKKLDKNLGTINQENKAFIIHESDKYYLSMEQGFETGWRTHTKGFHGRTIAILNYIDIMQNLSLKFNIGDPQLMKFVAYNLESHSPGANAKSAMEEIFTYAAGMIMFDDVGVAVKEATKQLEFSNITNIHLYKLEELYFPSSYILEQTADYLENLESDIEANNAAIAHITVGENIYAPGYINLATGKTKADIDSKLKKFIDKTPGQKWNTMRNYMIAQTKVSISFFLHFADFISKLPH